LINKFPNIIFLIDEAYFEFCRETMANQVKNSPNLFVSRTFSKAFALANFRAGYLISDKENIKQLSKIRNPKNFSTFSQEAVIGALSDIEYMTKYVAEVIVAREWMVEELKEFDYILHVNKSHANFILVHFNTFEDKMKVFKHLTENKIYVRNLLHSESLLNTLRISIGTRAQMRIVLEVLKTIT
jgi:histidinol-phosphate aminotransferase